jgi:hypothetical protein
MKTSETYFSTGRAEVIGKKKSAGLLNFVGNLSSFSTTAAATAGIFICACAISFKIYERKSDSSTIVTMADETVLLSAILNLLAWFGHRTFYNQTYDIQIH